MNTPIVLGALAIGAYLFRDQLSAALQSTTASPAVDAAKQAALDAAAKGATPAQQADAAAKAAATVPPAPINYTGDLKTPLNVLDTLASITEGFMVQAVRDAGDPIIGATTTLTVSQWNWYLTRKTNLPGMALGDDGSPILVAQYIALLQAYVARARGAV